MSEATDRPDRARDGVRCLVIPHICPDIGTFNHKSHFTEHILFYTLATGCFIFENYTVPNQTTSKRIPISLKPELYSVISSLAEIQNKPMSKVVVELFRGNASNPRKHGFCNA